MSDIKDSTNKELKTDKHETGSSSKNIKRIRKDLMGFAKEEILNIKKSKKEINIGTFEEKIAPSQYSLTAKHLKFGSFKSKANDEESKENASNLNNVNEGKGKKEAKNDNIKEISSSDISDEEDDDS